MKPIVRVEKLSKQYRVGNYQQAYDTLRESISGAVATGLNRLFRANTNNREKTIWALRDVSFEVAAGEVVGIIGRNGAGKSTLLKILSRITEPTAGRTELYGRVASLLEVGTGFHPELTGRENIYLNGAILGMRKKEIDLKFDQIVAFAELEKFLDTPVKRYSSGMYMRLAFAVASHLEPEILVVDEVLAVGDAHFQKKCLGKMSNVAMEGRTVLFVSHNMIAVRSLCQRAIWLEQGRIVDVGSARTVISNYLESSVGEARLLNEVWDDVESAPGNNFVRLHRISVRAEEDDHSAFLTMKSPFQIVIEYWNLPGVRLHIALHLYTQQDIVAFTSGNGADVAAKESLTATGLFRCVCHIPGDLLNTGWHRFALMFVRDSNSIIFRYESAVAFEIVDVQEREVSSYGREPGVVQPVLKWTTEQIGGPADISAR